MNSSAQYPAFEKGTLVKHSTSSDFRVCQPSLVSDLHIFTHCRNLSGVGIRLLWNFKWHSLTLILVFSCCICELWHFVCATWVCNWYPLQRVSGCIYHRTEEDGLVYTFILYRRYSETLLFLFTPESVSWKKTALSNVGKDSYLKNTVVGVGFVVVVFLGVFLPFWYFWHWNVISWFQNLNLYDISRNFDSGWNT